MKQIIIFLKNIKEVILEVRKMQASMLTKSLNARYY